MEINNMYCFVYIFLAVANVALGCEMHRRLERLAALRAARLEQQAAAASTQAISNLRDSLTGDMTSALEQPSYSRVSTSDLYRQPKTVLPRRYYVSNAPRPAQVNRYVPSSAGTRYVTYRDPNQVYVGQSSSYYPQASVRCPNSRYRRCPGGSVCVYESRRYKCRYPARTTCRDGFRRVNITATSFQCVDINECEDEELNTCDFVCRNTLGSFSCECEPGHRKDSNGTCHDIDECEEAIGRYQLCQHECVNTVGSYSCSCPDGYTSTRTSCQDIDECEANGTCSGNTKCVNLYGGYECNAPEPCDTGYRRANTTSGDFGPCLIEDYDQAIGSGALPVSVVRSRYPLHSGYPVGTEVAKLRFTKFYGHQYRFTLEGDSQYFSIHRMNGYGSNVLSITTRRKLLGDQVLSITVVVDDTDYSNNYWGVQFQDRKTTSHVVFDFVVSPYSF